MTGICGYLSQDIDIEKLFNSIKSIGYQIKELKDSRFCVLCSLDVKNNRKEKISKNFEEETSIVTCGEIYNEDLLNLEKSICSLYKTGNLHLLKKFNGSFAAAIYDKKQEKLTVVNDRYGSIKMFYYFDKDRFCFAPKIRPLLEFGAKKVLKKDALYDFLIFGFLLGEKTFFEDVCQLPPASILEFSKGNLKLTKYWDYEFNSKNYDTRPIELLVDDLGRLWEKSIERRIKKGKKFIIPLSGGFDSRAILAATLNCSSKDDIITYTFGDKGSYDYEIGKMIAQKTGVRNIPLGVEKKDFKNQYKISIDDTEGMIDATPYFAIRGYQKLNMFGDRIITGFMGGEIMGSLVLPKMMKFRLKSKRDYNRARNLIFNWRKRHDYKIVKKLCNLTLKDELYYKQTFNQLTRDLNKVNSKEFIDYCTSWLYKNEEWNYTSFCVLRFRNLFEYSIPFLDNDLVDFMLKIPPKLRLNKYLYKSMLLKKYPELFSLPTKNNYGHGIDADAVSILLSRIFLYLKRKSNSICNKIMKRNFFLDKNNNYIDYNNLLRTNKEYREFINHYINKVKNREYFNKDYIENIWKLQINGKKNYAMFLGLLVTFELFLEEYVDDPEIKQFNNRGL
jgi:asparagine synthase (glutamine-hydrolysing)